MRGGKGDDEGLQAYVEKLRGEADPRRLEAEVGEAVAALAVAERGAVSRALRAGAALRHLKAVAADAYEVTVRRLLGRSRRSANNYERLHKAYEASPEMRAAILAAPSLRQALALLPPTRSGRAPASRTASAHPFADVDALLRANADRGREVQRFFEAAAALARGGKALDTDPAASAAITGAIAAAFGSADPAELEARAARAAAAAGPTDEPGLDARDIPLDARDRAGGDVAIAGVLVGMRTGDNDGLASPAALADGLEKVAAALRGLALPGAEAETTDGPLAVVFEGYAAPAGEPAADVMVIAPQLALKAAAPVAGGARSPDALAAVGLLRHVDAGGRAVYVCAPHTAAVRMLASLGAGAAVMVNPRLDPDCIAAARVAAEAAGNRGGLGRALGLNDWASWPEARHMIGAVETLMAAAERAG